MEYINNLVEAYSASSLTQAVTGTALFGLYGVAIGLMASMLTKRKKVLTGVAAGGIGSLVAALYHTNV